MKPHVPEYRETILLDVHRERVRQNQLVANGDLPWNCADQNIPNAGKLPVLVEETGEVGKAVYETYNSDLNHDPALVAHLRVELIQLAAVCVAWVEALDEDAEDDALIMRRERL